jgi:S-(hydroxymethyl)glutathione dehydrogenase/alcohol dehydrogenase
VSLPKTTEAAILVKQREPLVVDTIDLPPELHFGQVLVELSYSGICGSQIGEIDGVKGEDRWLPHLLGHEGSGKILAVGQGVKTVAPGDHVVLHWRPGAGLQGDPPKYTRNGETINAGWVTTFNRHAVISEDRVTVIPKDFDLALAPLFGCAITTAFGIVNHDAAVEIGQSIVVIGVGGIGLNVVQGAAMVSANPIVAVDLIQTKLDMAKNFGATHTTDGADTNKVAALVSDLTASKGADVVVETTGIPAVIEAAYNMTAPDGKTILVGVPATGKKASLHTLPLHFGKVLTGSHGGSAQPDIEIPRYIQLAETGHLNLDGLVTDTFELGDINTAIDKVRSGESGRVMVRLGE